MVERLFPWQLRDFNGSCILAQGESGELALDCLKDNLNQSMLFVSESVIPGAGFGLFLRPHQSGMFFKRNDSLCLYSSEFLSRQEANNLSNSDYLIEVRGNRSVDALHFNGKNLGRYVNQGGLQHGLESLVRLLDFYQFGAYGVVESAAEERCQLKFAVQRGKVIMAVKDEHLYCRENAIELYVNYSIFGYWVSYLSRKDIDAGFPPTPGDPLVALLCYAVAKNASLPECQS